MGKKEIDFLDIEGHYGGDQNWMPHKMMRLGGCSTICAGELCATLAKNFGMEHICTVEPKSLTREYFVSFCCVVYHYIHPGFRGLDSISKFAEGFKAYMEYSGARGKIEELSGESSYEAAREFIRSHIDAGIPIAYLMLRHKGEAQSEFEWHWFTLTGYAEDGDNFDVCFASWGKRYTDSLKAMWDTGYRQKGGMVAVTPA